MTTQTALNKCKHVTLSFGKARLVHELASSNSVRSSARTFMPKKRQHSARRACPPILYFEGQAGVLAQR